MARQDLLFSGAASDPELLWEGPEGRGCGKGWDFLVASKIMQVYAGFLHPAAMVAQLGISLQPEGGGQKKAPQDLLESD